MATPRLYYDDPLLLTFKSTVVGVGRYADQPAVQLERTAFYPESGGQMGDRGQLGAVQVIDVQVGEDGIVQHLLAGEPPAVGSQIEGQIEKRRRRLFMALHTAQHMLSRALVDEAGAETVSARLGETSCSVDLDKSTLPDARIAKAEALVNAVIDDDVPIRAFFPSPEELSKLPLRRTPKVDKDIRVVAIGDFDVSPCGGTHCLRSAQVGALRVVSVEKQKGKLRVIFDAGSRAREGWVSEASALRKLAGRYTCGALEVEAAIDRLERDLLSARGEIKRLSKEAAGPLADGLLAQAQDPIVAELAGGRDMLRAVGAALCERSDRLFVLLTPDGDGLAVVIGRGPKGSEDAGARLKALAAACGGKGGGRPDWAEGRLPAGIDVASLLAAPSA